MCSIGEGTFCRDIKQKHTNLGTVSKVKVPSVAIQTSEDTIHNYNDIITFTIFELSTYTTTCLRATKKCGSGCQSNG